MRRHLITTALPYADGVTHPGHLVCSLLPADIYARFMRARGTDVLFVSATDEHGARVEMAAHEAGLEVGEYCHLQHEIQVRFAEEFGLSFDVFGRSSGAQVREQTQYFAKRLSEEGFLEGRSARRLFSPAEGRFLADRCIVGTCPHCGFDRARGDRCEDCERFLDPIALLDARSAISGARDLEVRDRRHLFLLQSKLVGRLREWLEARADWPLLARSLGLAQLDEGLKDQSVTRDSAWGVPVAKQDFEGKVYCAWFDAPIACIGATREWAEERGEPGRWREWWRASDDVWYVQFAAKDDVSFNPLHFPCIAIGSGEKWKLVDCLKPFHSLTYYGGRFAVEAFMFRGLELIPADCWRYYLIGNAPEAGDASFSWESIAAAVNADLADSFGNFVHRSLTFASRHFGGRIPAGGEPGPPELELLDDVGRLMGTYTERMDALEFRRAIDRLRAMWRRGNAYLDRKRPWVTIGSDRDDAELTLRFCINLTCLFARLSAPVMPFTADRVFDALAVPDADRSWPAGFDGNGLVPAHPFTAPPMLFRKVPEGDVGRWRVRFGAEPC
jgi:methionyl-tRNA synthetase